MLLSQTDEKNLVFGGTAVKGFCRDSLLPLWDRVEVCMGHVQIKVTVGGCRWLRAAAQVVILVLPTT